MLLLLLYLASLLIAGCIGGSVMIVADLARIGWAVLGLAWHCEVRQSTEAVPSIRRHRRTSFSAVDHEA